MHNLEFHILIALSIQFSVVECICTIVHWSPGSMSRTLSSQIEMPHPLHITPYSSFLFSPGRHILLSVFTNLTTLGTLCNFIHTILYLCSWVISFCISSKFVLVVTGSEFTSFLMLNSILLHVCLDPILFIHSFITEHGGFFLLAITNNAAMYMWTWLCRYQCPCFQFFSAIPRSGIPGLSMVLNIFTECFFCCYCWFW